MARKTMNVSDLLVSVNRCLTDAADHQDATMGSLHEAKAFRIGAAMVLEHALHATGNYHGFRYTDPKAEFTDTGIVEGTYDETRRAYYGPTS
jgi:hypothetical protein